MEPPFQIPDPRGEDAALGRALDAAHARLSRATPDAQTADLYDIRTPRHLTAEVEYLEALIEHNRASTHPAWYAPAPRPPRTGALGALDRAGAVAWSVISPLTHVFVWALFLVTGLGIVVGSVAYFVVILMRAFGA